MNMNEWANERTDLIHLSDMYKYIYIFMRMHFDIHIHDPDEDAVSVRRQGWAGRHGAALLQQTIIFVVLLARRPSGLFRLLALCPPPCLLERTLLICSR